MSGWARPGVKCVCVESAFYDGRPSPLIKGATYTIRGVRDTTLGRDMQGLFSQGPSVILAEAHNPFHPDGSFDIARFRPLITRTQEQDAALFRPILDAVPIEESA